MPLEVDQACSRHKDTGATGRALGSAVNREAVWPGDPQGTLPEAETDVAFPLCSDGALRRWARGTLPHTSPTLNVQEKNCFSEGISGSTQVHGLPSAPPPAHKPVPLFLHGTDPQRLEASSSLCSTHKTHPFKSVQKSESTTP